MGVEINISVETLVIISIVAITTIVNRTRSKKGHLFRWQHDSPVPSNSSQSSQATVVYKPVLSPVQESEDGERSQAPFLDRVSPLDLCHSPPVLAQVDGVWDPDAVLDDAAPVLPPPTHATENWLPVPNTKQFQDNLSSRILRKFPFSIEILYLALTCLPYYIADTTRDAAVEHMATENAIRILNIEKELGFAFEKPLQQFILKKCSPWVVESLCRVYNMHTGIVVAFLGYGFTYFSRYRYSGRWRDLPRQEYKGIRRSIAISNWLALILSSLYRCTPPRLMPESFGFMDPLHFADEASIDWNIKRSEMTLDAMSTLPFGTALLIVASISVWGKHSLLRILAPLYPMAMGLAVIVTANDWVLICVAELLLLFVGWNINWVLLGLRPFEKWLFWVLRTEEPGVPVEALKHEDDVHENETDSSRTNHD